MAASQKKVHSCLSEPILSVFSENDFTSEVVGNVWHEYLYQRFLFLFYPQVCDKLSTEKKVV